MVEIRIDETRKLTGVEIPWYRQAGNGKPDEVLTWLIDGKAHQISGCVRQCLGIWRAIGAVASCGGASSGSSSSESAKEHQALAPVQLHKL